MTHAEKEMFIKTIIEKPIISKTIQSEIQYFRNKLQILAESTGLKVDIKVTMEFDLPGADPL